MIAEPQRAHLLELYWSLGLASEDFVVAGGQAMKFQGAGTRATKDFDFILDAVHLRERGSRVRPVLSKLGYVVVPESQNFQFQKAIAGTAEVMRIEFLAPDELQRNSDFRVEVQEGVHAHGCEGGAIALREVSEHVLAGRLPDGQTAAARVKVVKPHALVMLKMLALEERHRNTRGKEHARHDRARAGVHAADIVAILGAQPDRTGFGRGFWAQFEPEYATLRDKLRGMIPAYFGNSASPGILLYEEHLAAGLPSELATRRDLAYELERAQRLVGQALVGER